MHDHHQAMGPAAAAVLAANFCKGTCSSRAAEEQVSKCGTLKSSCHRRLPSESAAYSCQHICSDMQIPNPSWVQQVLNNYIIIIMDSALLLHLLANSCRRAKERHISQNGIAQEDLLELCCYM